MRLPTRPIARPARLVACLLPGLIGACVAPRPPLPEVAGDHYAGSVLSGPTSEHAAPAPIEAPQWAELRVAYAQRPPTVATPLAASARQILVDGGEPLRTRSELALDALRFDGGAELADDESTHHLEAVLPGTTAVFRIEPALAAGDAPRTQWRRIDVRIASRAGAIEIGLVIEGEQREHWILDPLPADTNALTLFFPAPYVMGERARHGGFLAVLRFTAAEVSQAELDLALQRARADVLFSRELALRKGRSGSPVEERLVERGSALRALHDPTQRRAALVYLADAAGAPATADLALAGDETTLLRYVDVLDARLLAQDGVETVSLGWLLESETHAFLARLAGDDPVQVAPELRSVQLRHAGQLALFPDVVLELVNELGEQGSVAALQARFSEENRAFLADAHAAARVRACEWLQRRGAVPAGYDPLGPLDERRAALAADERACEAAAEEPP